MRSGLLTRGLRLTAAATAIAAAVLVGACGGNDENGSGGNAAASETVDRSDINIAFVPAAPANDPFWSIVKNGVDQAAEDLGVNVQFKGLETFDIAQYVSNLEAAIATKPDGLVVNPVDIDAVGAKIEEAVDAGIPVISMNSGVEESFKFGAIAGVGSAEFEAGRQGGERMRQAGVTNALCVNPFPGDVALDQRCDGFEEGLGGQSEVLAVDGGDPTKALGQIEAAVKARPDLDGIMSGWAPAASQSHDTLEKLGKLEDVQVATFDLDPEALELVRDGEVLFAIDQQPYLQGYLPVLFFTQLEELGVTPVGFVQTGPLFVTEENAEQALELSREGLR